MNEILEDTMTSVRRATRRLFMLGLPCLLAAGCAQTLPSQMLQPMTTVRALRPTLDFEEPSQGPEPTTLAELLKLAITHHPELKAAYARVEIARGNMIQAGLYPNPQFGPQFAQLGDVDNRLGEPGARFIQTFVTANKLGIARQAGAHGVQAADWAAMTKMYSVVTRVRIAYFELLTAINERETLTNIVNTSQKAYDATVKLEKAGVGSQPDVLRAMVELEQNQLKRGVSLRRVEAAKQNLLTALGRPPLALDRLELNRLELTQPAPSYDWKAMLECLRENSSELQETRALVAQAQKLLARARVEPRPNLLLTAIPFYESPQRSMHLEFYVTAPIPIFDRNQGNIHAAEAQVAQAVAQEGELELRLTEQMTNAFLRYRAARQQAEAYRDVIVPKARDSRALIEKAYQIGGDAKKYDYTAVLQAQQVQFQAELSYAQALGELWRSVTDIAGILQQDDLRAGCGMR
jgi:cobalt-zinc-cadmium efflux system outer membrane protein